MPGQEERSTDGRWDPFETSSIEVRILDGLPCAVLLIDRELVVRYRNAPATELLPDKTGAAAALASLHAPEPFEGWETELKSLIRQGLSRRWEDVACEPTPGQPVSLNLACQPIRRGDDQNVLGLLMTIEFTSQRPAGSNRPQAEARLMSLGKLTARVAHELNNPLDGILRYINLAIRIAESPPQARRPEETQSPNARLVRYLHESRTGLIRMVGIVRDVLEFSRGAQERYDSLNINDIVDEATRTVAPLADAHRVIIAADYQVQGMPCAPAGRLLQVCTNLMKNAIEAMPHGGRLLINTGIVDTDVVLRFADTGPGLPEHIERLFEPFYTTKDSHEGTGLGLAICRDFVEQMGGTIHARNGDHDGAVFTVAIPLSACHAAPSSAPARREAPVRTAASDGI